jgi:hypothetical protein
MAYTQVQIIADTDRRHVVKRVNYANTETNALVVNAAALSYAVVAVTTDSSANNFKVGETVNSSSGGTATVQDVLSPTVINLIDVSGTFADNDTITGATTLRTRTQNGAVAPETYTLQVARILYDTSNSNNNEIVELMWEGTGGGANNRTITTLTGKGVYEFDTHGARIPNNANTPTGNIILSTTNWNGNSAYTLVIDVNKSNGYAQPYLQRNAVGRY